MIHSVNRNGDYVDVIYSGDGATYGNTNEWNAAKRRAYCELYGKTEADLHREHIYTARINRRVQLVSIYARGAFVESLTFAKR